MPDVKISDATSVPTLEATDMVPIARAGSDVPLNATLETVATYVTILASAHPPEMSGDPNPGKMEQYSSADHVHPPNTGLATLDSPKFVGTPSAPMPSMDDCSDCIPTTEWVVALLGQQPPKAPIDSPTFVGTPRAPTPGIDDDTDIIATTEYFHNQGSTEYPQTNGVQTAGVSKRWSREDHIHGTDVSRAAVSAIPLPSTTLPVMDGTPTVGTGSTFARADHQHGSDTSRYPVSNPAGYQSAAQIAAALQPYALLDSPQFKGNPTAPNPTPSTDADSSIATTYFVRTGIIDGSEALPGQVGEYLSAQCMSTAPVALTSGVDTGIVTLALGAGDWDLMASIGFTMANNNSTSLKAWINTTGGGAAPPIDQIGGNIVMPVANNTPQVIMPLVPTRVNITTTTNMRLGATVTTSGGTISGWGKLMARRRR